MHDLIRDILALPVRLVIWIFQCSRRRARRVAGIPDETLDVFFREIAHRSTATVDRAEALIAEWEKRVCDDERNHDDA